MSNDRMKVIVLLAAVAVAAAAGFAADVPAIDPIVPIAFYDGYALDDYAKDVRDAKRRFGLKRFTVIGDSVGPKIAELREKIADPEIQLGWWCCPTLWQKADNPYARVMDDDGHRATFCVCPYDPAFRKAFFANVEKNARAARPFIVFFEDDYTLAVHPGLNPLGGCFCPRHMAAFHKASGTTLSAKEVGNMFRNRTPENLRYREIFAHVQRDSLADFAQGIRAALDRVDPTIRTCICQSWKAHVDGCSSPAVARALAGPNTKPAVRVFGSYYGCEDELWRIPGTLANMACAVAEYPPDIEIFHETDSHPHSRFFNSAAFLTAELAGAVMSGARESYFYCTQYLDDPFEDTGYEEAFCANRARLGAVRAFRSRSDLVGVRTTYAPRDEYLVRVPPSGTTAHYATLARFLSKLGFPFAVKKGPMAVFLGNAVETLEDGQIREILKGGVFLDAPAVSALAARGYGELLGVGVAEAKDGLNDPRERILPVSGYARKGRYVNNYQLGRTLPAVRLEPGPKTEVWSEYLGPDGKRVAPSVTYFENKLGGRVGVMALAVAENTPTSIPLSSSLFSSRKQELLKLLFDRLSRGELPVTSTATPAVWLLAAESRDGRELLVMANNLSGDVRNDVRFEFSKRWTGRRVSRLDADGKWIPCGTTAAAWTPGIAFAVCRPEFFLIGDAF